jgi:diguanylate cyclase (GGDEF)-like protein/PAS domain S-box-containing protein
MKFICINVIDNALSLGRKMFKVIGCFVDAHDLRLVALAAAVCIVSSLTVVALLRHSRQISGLLQALWLGIAAVAGGSGIWATHFIAMLAFAPDVPSAYDLPLTVLSLLVAIALCGLGFSVSILANRRSVSTLGGAIVGGGIATMHYTGMAAYEVAGRVSWDPVIVGTSILLGAVLGAVALPVAVCSRTRGGQMAGALFLVAAICSHHFTAMGAVTITPDPLIAISPSALPTSWLAVAVALASFALLLLAGAALGTDIRDRRHAALEGERLRSLANAAVEGLVVCKGDRIVNANRSFAKLVGLDPLDVGGRTLSDFLCDPAIRLTMATSPEQASETELRRADGESIPVEIIMQSLVYASEPHYAVAIRDLRARRRAEGRIHFLAHHDPLTGLANRAAFNTRLEQDIELARASGGRLAVLCLDLDRFKEVNDLFGHAAGDSLLVTVGRIITGLLDQGQTVARLGGDEFAVLVPCHQAIEAGNLAEQIIEALRSGEMGHEGPQIATSIGIALYPDDAIERQLLLGHADTALYRAKSEGRGTYRFFEARMGAQVHERRMLEHDLRHAIARGEVRLVYQPQQDIGTGELTGFEALIRWHHPQRGQVSPALFIPIAEESGLILQIGEWVLREACKEATSWDKPLSIAVNVSAVQIHAPAFSSFVHETLIATGLAPDRLELEITETALVRDQTRALLTLRQLKALGLRIAMDDFGTGYSSLSNLRAFPFDKIKIDASFMTSVETNTQASAIVKSVLGLGAGLGIPVLAEGVETDGQLKFLERENCNAAQGYFLGRPAPIEQLAHLVSRRDDKSPTSLPSKAPEVAAA